MKVLITGGRGFIGSYVHEELEKYGHEVYLLSNLSHPSKNSKGRNFIYGDIRYQYDTDRAIDGMDCCIHLAARINVDRSRDDCRPFVDTNIIGTYNVLESCRKYKVKLIHASTSEALGSMQLEYCEDQTIGKNEKDKHSGMSELHPYSPDNPYGATKAAADMLVKGWIKSYDLNACLLRSFNVTGVGQSYDKEGAFIPKVIQRIINGENPIIFGAGDQTRDYVWVGDLARVYRMLAERDDVKGETFHIGTGVEVTIEYVANKLIEISKKPLRIEYIAARPKEVKRLKCNYAKAERLLGYKPTKFIDDILKEMYDHALLE